MDEATKLAAQNMSLPQFADHVRGRIAENLSASEEQEPTRREDEPIEEEVTLTQTTTTT